MAAGSSEEVTMPSRSRHRRLPGTTRKMALLYREILSFAPERRVFAHRRHAIVEVKEGVQFEATDGFFVL